MTKQLNWKYQYVFVSYREVNIVYLLLTAERRFLTRHIDTHLLLHFMHFVYSAAKHSVVAERFISVSTVARALFPSSSSSLSSSAHRLFSVRTDMHLIIPWMCHAMAWKMDVCVGHDILSTRLYGKWKRTGPTTFRIINKSSSISFSICTPNNLKSILFRMSYLTCARLYEQRSIHVRWAIWIENRWKSQRSRLMKKKRLQRTERPNKKKKMVMHMAIVYLASLAYPSSVFGLAAWAWAPSLHVAPLERGIRLNAVNTLRKSDMFAFLMRSAFVCRRMITNPNKIRKSLL